MPTYRVEFDDPTSLTLYGFRLPGEDTSTAHSAELRYLFDFTLGERPLTATQERLSDQMMRYWGAFRPERQAVGRGRARLADLRQGRAGDVPAHGRREPGHHDVRARAQLRVLARMS